MFKNIVIGVVAVTGSLFYIYGATSFFSPKYAEVRNVTFKNTQAYNDGMINDLADLRLHYLGANTADRKEAIRAVVLQRFASYPKERLPSELRDFYDSL